MRGVIPARTAYTRMQASPKRNRSPPKPNFVPSGLLAAAANTVQIDVAKAKAAGATAEELKKGEKGVVLKYHEPPESRKPISRLRLYVFKGSEQVGE